MEDHAWNKNNYNNTICSLVNFIIDSTQLNKALSPTIRILLLTVTSKRNTHTHTRLLLFCLCVVSCMNSNTTAKPIYTPYSSHKPYFSFHFQIPVYTCAETIILKT